MNFFGKAKPVVKQERKGEKTVFRIDYYKLNKPEEYKKKLFARLIGSSKCLIIVNSENMYKEQKARYLNSRQALFERLAEEGLVNRSIAVEREEPVTVFGLTVKKNEKRTYGDHIIGLVVDEKSIEAAVSVLNGYNLYYYIYEDSHDTDKMLDVFEKGYQEDEKLGQGAQYTMLDDNFLKGIAIYCKAEDTEQTFSLIESL